MIGYYCGLRIAETYGLTWDDIDFETREITIRHQCVSRNYGVLTRDAYKKKGKQEEHSAWYLTPKLKTKRSARKIKFGQTLFEVLKAEKKRQMENELLYGEYYMTYVGKPETDSDGIRTITRLVPVPKSIQAQYPRINLVCLQDNGELASKNTFRYCTRVCRNELTLAFDYHSLRHTHATKLIESGAPIKSVSARLGHSSVQITIDTYVHNTEQMIDETVETFELAASGLE